MFFAVKIRRVIIAVLAAALITAAVLACRSYFVGTRAVSAPQSATLVIDPGHGGIDGGAIAADGTRESGINLAIAQRMAALAALYGRNCVLTRDTEESGVSIDEYSEHDDLVKRAALVNSIPGAVLVSVHQNNYPTPGPCGAQVMYAATEGSRALGEAAQRALVSFADPLNRRVASPVPEDLLLTASVSCPAILSECGFMSNPAEAAALGTPDYQLKISCALIAAYINFADKSESV